MKRASLIMMSIIFLFLSTGVVLSNCGGGGGGSSSPIPPPPNSGPFSGTFSGGTLADLKTLSPNLEFGDLTIIGSLYLSPGDGPVNIKAANFILGDSGKFLFGQNACSYKQAPDINITATGSVVIDGDAGFYLHGKDGDQEPVGCNDCDGVRGGNVTIQAVDIRIGETKGGRFQVYGGYGSRSYITGGYFGGCTGGNGGTVTLNASGRLVIGPKTIIDLYGGDACTTCYVPGTPGVDGTINLTGASIEVYENSWTSNARILPQYKLLNNYIDRLLVYQRFILYGSVNQADDISDKGQPGDRLINYGNPVTATDFCEDLYVLRLKTAATINLKLSSAGSGDLDIFLGNYAADSFNLYAYSNGPTSSESITYAAGAGKYVICVSWADSNAVPASEPQPYTLEVGL